MGRILGIDYGGKRVGLAITDPLQISINPLETIHPDKLDLVVEHLISIEYQDISAVIFGLPSHMDGTLTQIGAKIVELKGKYEKKYPAINWDMIDEAFTSKDARRMMVHLGMKKKQREKKENLDKMSAVLILKSYLDQI